MKSFGCNSEHNRERSHDLFRNYSRLIESCKHIKADDIFARVVEMPASRFWVSTSRAAVVMANIMRGDKLDYMRPNKREMFFEIYHRMVELRHRRSDWSVPRLLDVVLAQPAPKFYMAPGSARVIILKERKKWFIERVKNTQG